MTTVSLSQPSIPHFFHAFVLLFLFIFALIESRRYVYYHVVKSRVRLLETGFYVALLRGGADLPTPLQREGVLVQSQESNGVRQADALSSPLLSLDTHGFKSNDKESFVQDQQRWLSQLAESLLSPQPSTSFGMAFLIRLRRVYLYLMFAVLLTWTLKAWLQGVVWDNIVLLSAAYGIFVVVLVCCLYSSQEVRRVVKCCRRSREPMANTLYHFGTGNDNAYNEVDV